MQSQPPAIVLIEKDDVTLELYQRELRKSFQVLPFTDLKDVLATIERCQARAVVIEPEIQAGQGWALIHSIHATFPNRFIPVIVCSTRDGPEAGLAREAAKYLTKPVLPKTLRRITLEVLGISDTLPEAT